MPGYVVFFEDVLDAQAFERYKAMSPVSIRRFGGRFLVRGGAVTELEGAFDAERVVIIEFPSAAVAREWYHSPDYADARALRLAISRGQAFIVEGVASTPEGAS